jgi:hypothetical protein
MGKIKTLTTISALGLITIACSGANVTVTITDLPVIEVMATHAIETENKTTSLTFVPNDVAPWLGRLVLSDSEAILYTTDIEGREPHKTNPQQYADIVGLNRQQSSGVFLALSREDKKLDAFIESNEEGHFSVVSYSGAELNPKSFCISDRPKIDQVRLLSAENKIIDISVSVKANQGAQMSMIEQQVITEMDALPNAALCAYSGDNTYTLSPETSILGVNEGQGWDEVFLPAGTTAFTPVTLNNSPYLLLLNGSDILVFDVYTYEFESRISVSSGLSIAGFDQADFVVATSSNFGGGAFNAGLIAFGHTNENRIVFISLSYIENAILSGVL